MIQLQARLLLANHHASKPKDSLWPDEHELFSNYAEFDPSLFTLKSSALQIVQFVRDDLQRYPLTAYQPHLLHCPFYGRSHVVAATGLAQTFEDLLKSPYTQVTQWHLMELLSTLQLLEESLRRQEMVWGVNRSFRGELSQIIPK